MPVPITRIGRLILVDAPRSDTAGVVAVYARVSSADQKADLDRQVARVTAWAGTHGLAVSRVETKVGSALNGRRGRVLALLRDRFARFGTEYVEAAMAAQGRRLLVSVGGVTASMVRAIAAIHGE